MIKISEQLKAGKALIENPKNWLQDAYCDGGIRNISNATCFCSVGAAHRVKGWDAIGKSDSFDITYLLWRAVGCNVESYNDNHTHAEVMAMWDKAIELAEKDEENE